MVLRSCSTAYENLDQADIPNFEPKLSTDNIQSLQPESYSDDDLGNWIIFFGLKPQSRNFMVKQLREIDALLNEKLVLNDNMEPKMVSAGSSKVSVNVTHICIKYHSCPSQFVLSGTHVRPKCPNVSTCLYPS